MTPNQAQLNALRQWASQHGRNWKSALRQAWMTGDYDGFDNANLLQQVRNTFGPSWLNRFVIHNGRNTIVSDSGNHQVIN